MQLMGWGGDDNIPCTCTLGDVTQLQLMGWGGDGSIPCTCTHVRCYATDGAGMVTFLALAHM